MVTTSTNDSFFGYVPTAELYIPPPVDVQQCDDAALFAAVFSGEQDVGVFSPIESLLPQSPAWYPASPAPFAVPSPAPPQSPFAFSLLPAASPFSEPTTSPVPSPPTYATQYASSTPQAPTTEQQFDTMLQEALFNQLPPTLQTSGPSNNLFGTAPVAMLPQSPLQPAAASPEFYQQPAASFQQAAEPKKKLLLNDQRKAFYVQQKAELTKRLAARSIKPKKAEASFGKRHLGDFLAWRQRMYDIYGEFVPCFPKDTDLLVTSGAMDLSA